MKTLLLILAFSLLFIQILHSQIELTAMEQRPEEIYSACSDAVVLVNKYDRDNTLLGYGSGVIVSARGVVYTNYHVIERGFRIEIRNGNDIYDSIPIVGFDPFNDAAILKLPEGNYPFIRLSSDENTKPGSSIYALGNPIGYSKTFTPGIVSAIRSDEKPNEIQLSAAISPGSSGGALLNMLGELIGITSSSVPKGQNLNFAIPVKNFSQVPIADLNNPEQKELIKQMLALYANTDTTNDLDTQAKTISEFCNLYNNDTIKWEFAGRFYLWVGESDSAAACFTRGIELTRGNKFLYKLRGDSYANLSDTVKALSDYAKSISLCNSYLDAYIERAEFYDYTLKDYEKAIEDYDMVVKLNPEYDFVYTRKASCRLGLQDKQGAIRELSKGLSWNAGDPLVYNLRAEIYSMLEMYDEALFDYENSLIFAPEQTELYLDCAVLYSKKGDHSGAIWNYQQYLKYYPDDAAALNNLAYAYMSIEQFPRSEEYFYTSISIDKYHLDSYIGLAILNYRLGRTKSSIQNMCKAIEINDILLNGMPGIAELEKRYWFWAESDKKCIKKIFKLMSITDTKIKPVKDPRKRPEKVKRETAESGNE